MCVNSLAITNVVRKNCNWCKKVFDVDMTRQNVH